MFSTLESFDTVFSADSVEWCPIENFKDIFVCGTYQLSVQEKIDDSESKRRLGKVFLFRVEYGKLNMLQKFESAAVLDMKWAHSRVFNKILLGVATSKGILQIYELMGISEPTLELIKQIKVEENEEVILALSLDWSIADNSSVKVAVSASNGSVNVFELTHQTLEKIKSWHGHDYEAWITAFNYWDPNIIYSGGDDSKFKSFDLRVDTPTMISRAHSAGVTSLHNNAGREFSLASGSYDEQLRLWDTRKFGYPVSNIELGGGIWRLKWDPFEYKYLLAACMYGGFRIVGCEDIEKPKILGEYNEHESISYGCDWSFLNSSEIIKRDLFPEPGKKVALISTCSFYDHLLNLALVEFP